MKWHGPISRLSSGRLKLRHRPVVDPSMVDRSELVGARTGDNHEIVAAVRGRRCEVFGASARSDQSTFEWQSKASAPSGRRSVDG